MTPKTMTTAAIVLAGAALGACGSSSSDTTSAASTATKAAGAAKPAAAAATDKMTVGANEYAFLPTTINAKPGKFKVTLDNKGKIPHEFVLLKTSQAPDALKVKKGRVSEAASVGEVSETDAGKTKTSTLNLKPGSYVYVCNIPGHYGLGMRGTLTVK